ncbi:4982_t:CDS:2 [Diversispora eburnea]|uniref:4982_t:CDS:1 n=1 Tax=Diversispora eburnea TaxID=1213867 RepID=A0A9N9F3R5_9GLOM|nr:4982_t:CDS:2 [Diversispora eburnea]
MPQEMEKINYCSAGHSSEDFVYSDCKNSILSIGECSLCTKEHFIQEFKTWSSGNANIDKILQESQANNDYYKLQYLSYDNFQNIEHIADGVHGSVYSAELENGIKRKWNFIKQDWDCVLIGQKVALKEIKDSRYNVTKFLKVVKTVQENYSFTKYYGISKNPSTQNYIIIMNLYDDDLHNFLIRNFWDLGWELKLDILKSIAWLLIILNGKDFINYDLHSGKIFVKTLKIFDSDLRVDLGLSRLNSNNKNNQIYGSIPYIPPEELRKIKSTNERNNRNIYKWYLDLMYRCWSDDPSERPTAVELSDLFFDISEKLFDNIVDNDVMRQLKIADENQKNTSKSQKQELFELFSHSSKLHPQSSYIGRYIHTLHGLHDLLEEIKSGNLSVQ